MAALGRSTALVFTGGIGEHAPAVRAQICEGLAWAGIALDRAVNEAARSDARIRSARAKVDAWVIATDEERMLARDTRVRLEATRE
jgi:acetate kinase